MDRNGVVQLRHEVLHLHKALVEVEREDLERREGRLTPHQFLDRLLHDEAYAWMKQLSALIIGLDEWLDDPAAAPDAADEYIAALRQMVQPDPAGDAFQQRYAARMQTSPAVVMAHAAVVRALTKPTR